MTKSELLQAIKSVGAAMLGVQSNENRIKDFKQGSLPAFIIVGIIATLLFVLAVASIASLVAG